MGNLMQICIEFGYCGNCDYSARRLASVSFHRILTPPGNGYGHLERFCDEQSLSYSQKVVWTFQMTYNDLNWCGKALCQAYNPSCNMWFVDLRWLNTTVGKQLTKLSDFNILDFCCFFFQKPRRRTLFLWSRSPLCNTISTLWTVYGTLAFKQWMPPSSVPVVMTLFYDTWALEELKSTNQHHLWWDRVKTSGLSKKDSKKWAWIFLTTSQIILTKRKLVDSNLEIQLTAPLHLSL